MMKLLIIISIFYSIIISKKLKTKKRLFDKTEIHVSDEILEYIKDIDDHSN